MIHLKLHKLYLGTWLIFTLAFVTNSYAQTPLQCPEATWKKLSASTAFPKKAPTKDIETDEKKPETPKNSELGSSALATILIWLLSLGLLTTLAYLLWRSKKNTRIPDTDYTLEEIEQNLTQAPVKSLLDQAIEQKKYRRALRLYYLHLLKTLHQNEYIEWQIDKTNGQYIQELSLPEIQKPFKTLTYTFEGIWYRDTTLTKAQFEPLQTNFQQLLHIINKTNT